MTEEIYEVLSEVLVKMNIFWLTTVFVIALCVFVFTEMIKIRKLIIDGRNRKNFSDGPVQEGDIFIQIDNSARAHKLRKEIEHLIMKDYSDVSLSIRYGGNFKVGESQE